MNTYTDAELERLHDELYGILAEIVRVCNELDIPYFIQGGTAIGAFFEQAILPWDDDIDVGLTRDNYERFLREAPSRLKPPYTLQWLGTDPHTPFYFAKVRKNGTRFVEANFAHIDMHHGIYVDVFPFDKVPDTPWLQRTQRTVANFFNCCFLAKEIWLWRHIKKCQIENPSNRGLLPCLATIVVCTLFSKGAIYAILRWIQSLFNGGRHTYYNMVLMPRDHISVASLETPQLMSFGPVTVSAPNDLETYLRHHYPRLRRHIPKEEQMNHRPIELDFGDSHLAATTDGKS